MDSSREGEHLRSGILGHYTREEPARAVASLFIEQM
jgi:hypothetical protein